MLSFGIKKDFKNKRGSIGIGMIEPFSKYKDFKEVMEHEERELAQFRGAVHEVNKVMKSTCFLVR